MKTYFIALFCAIGFYWNSVAAADVTVSDAWVRATAPGQTVGGAYFKIQSAQTAYLVGASSTAAKVVEVHQMSLENNVMKMRPLPRLELPAGSAVELKPGGYHLMMMGITRPLVKGDKVDLKLIVEDKTGRRQTVDVKAEVGDIGATKMR
ncbi:MAG: hypothetical protein JWN94_998 [Betaproteobacteria bacterium]|nr:hypothetical protein [Betaproteobacteria bacterium]